MKKKWFCIGVIEFGVRDHWWKTEVLFITEEELREKINHKDFTLNRFKTNLFIDELQDSGEKVSRKDFIEKYFEEEFIPAG